MTKDEIKVGDKLVHKFLGTVQYTEACAMLETLTGSPDSLHVEHHGDIKEITLSLLTKET